VTTYAACLTPPGTAAIAVLAIRGAQAWDIVGDLFQPRTAQASGGRKPPVERDDNRGLTPPARQLQLQVGRFWLGRFGEDVADEVVLSVHQIEPAPWLELHCHGGVEVVRMCLDALRRRGVEVCSWQELESLTGGNRLHASGLNALTEARTVRTAAILLDQVHGSLARALQSILSAIDANDVSNATRQLADLLRYADLGRHLTRPWRVVVAGAPNVGKSSLVNALAGYQRSIVAPTPGTTRDVVSVEIAADGWPIELIDTAGLRSDAGTLEAQGIDLARDALAAADLCLWVLDASARPVWPDVGSDQLRLVVNKTDLKPAWDLEQTANSSRVSAQTGAGITDLLQVLAQQLVPRTPPPGAAVPFTTELCDVVATAHRLLDAGRTDQVRQLVRDALA
jgi:tRNA modification GTPase